jgi:tungstate transport system substrate-binding protein
MRIVAAFLTALAWLLGGFVAEADERADRALLLATTTSVRDSRLFDALLPLFRERTGIAVHLVAVGSGAALRMGAEGNADVLVTHAPDAEKTLVEEGILLDRRPFMENFFVLVGPPEDPAGVREAATATEAIRRIAAEEAPFVSRGDDSGTHRCEVALFHSAGVDPDARWKGFVRTGAGMGHSLQVAGERRAYVLSDNGTFRAFRIRIGLAALSRPEPALRNVYSVTRPNPARFPPGSVRVEAAERFADFLLSGEVETQGPLFVPISPSSTAKTGAQ